MKPQELREESSPACGMHTEATHSALNPSSTLVIRKPATITTAAIARGHSSHRPVPEPLGPWNLNGSLLLMLPLPPTPNLASFRNCSISLGPGTPAPQKAPCVMHNHITATDKITTPWLGQQTCCRC